MSHAVAMDPTLLPWNAWPPSWRKAASSARRLHITQSAVSQRLRALEAQVGSVLIVRSRPLKPTSAGQLLLKHTKQLRLLRAIWSATCRSWPQRPGGLARRRAHLHRHQCRQHCHLGHDALDDLVRQRLPLEIITDDQDFTQEWLRSGQVLGCVTTLKQACAAARWCRWAPCAMWPWPRPTLPQRPAAGADAAQLRDVPFCPSTARTTCSRIRGAHLWAQARGAEPPVRAQHRRADARRVGGLGRGRAARAAGPGPDCRWQLVDLVPGHFLPIQLYWHCWNLESELLDALTEALKATAATTLVT
jgi:LysR family transcriptional regulator (chromosome initiation inhibitor)